MVIRNTIVNQTIADYWNKRGESYSRSWQSVAKRRLNRSETDLVRNVIELASQQSCGNKLRTLDIGIGTGRISEVILEYDVEHYGTDVSQTMIDYCGVKFEHNIKIKQLSIHDILNPIPKEWGEFNVVTAIRVLSYMTRWRQGLQNIYHTMKPGGYLVFTFPNRYSSALLTKWIIGKRHRGCELTFRELKKSLSDIGFSHHQIEGFSKLFDTLYDRCNDNRSTNLLFNVEKFLNVIFGSTLFTRLFYVICKKEK